MAHRGDSANFPENTMQSLKSAAEIGVDVLETDIHLTKDNEFVLFHDEDIERTTGRPGTIRERTLEELRQIDLGETFTLDGTTYPFRGKGLHAITLTEALTAFPDIVFNIDMKDNNPEAPVLLTNLLRNHNRTDSVIVGSFHSNIVNRLHEIAPEVAIAANPSQVKRFVLGLKTRLLPLMVRSIPFKAFQVPIRSGSIEVVNPRFIRAAHQRMVAVHVWTINNQDEMEALLDMGVDGIFTDKPALLREILHDRGLLSA